MLIIGIAYFLLLRGWVLQIRGKRMKCIIIQWFEILEIWRKHYLEEARESTSKCAFLLSRYELWYCERSSSNVDVLVKTICVDFGKIIYNVVHNHWSEDNQTLITEVIYKHPPVSVVLLPCHYYHFYHSIYVFCMQRFWVLMKTMIFCRYRDELCR